MNRAKAVVEQLEARTLLSASLVKDINTDQFAIPGLWGSVGAGDIVFLSQDDGVAGWELYKTDGTTAGTVLVKDIRPGRDNSQPGWVTPAGGGTIFFTANDGTNGGELWKSDGTAAGTVMVKDINPGAASSSPGSLVNVNGTIFFSANDGANGVELWKSDGTEAGTVMVKNIYTGTTGIPATPASSSPTQLINNNGTLFFRATTFESGFELWKSDGSDAGTVQVTELYNNNNDGMANTPMAVLNGFVYFAGRTSTGAIDLWKSDGTGPGTTLVKDLPSASTPTNIKKSGSRVFFTVTQAGDLGLWRTDGTTTTNVIAAASVGGIDVNGSLFFGSGGTLYKADATSLTPLRSGFTFNASNAMSWGNANGTLFFGANDGSGIGDELWKSDSITGVTELVKDIESGPPNSSPFGIVPYGPGGTSGVIFGTFGGPTGGALHRSDGTAAGTVMIKDIYPGTADSAPFLMIPFNNAMYFVAFEPGYGATGGGELYRSDGTEAGTGIFHDLFPGPTGGSIGGNVGALKVFGNHLYFTGNDGSGIGKELWRTDGTSVSFVKDVNPGSPDSSIGGMTVSGSFLYFWATTATHGEELWRTDGTSFGTLRMSNNTAIGTTINNPTDVNGTLYYTVQTSTGGFAGLWNSDGFGSIGIATSFTGVSSMLNVNGTLYISATTSGSGAELWKIAPGGSTPVLVKDINTSGSSSPANLTNVDGTLFFSASTSANGVELWKSDGTDASTVLVKDIRPGSSNSILVQPNFVTTHGVLYFRADNGVVGNEIWRSDGTAAGTYLVKDIAPAGATNGIPTRLFAANGFVYFGATDDNSISLEAWRSDGTAAGTVPLGNYYPANSFFNNPSNVAFGAALNGEFYYAFNDDTHGRELWKADAPQFATLGGGVITVTATANNDSLDVSVVGGEIVVTLNGLSQSFAAAGVTAVHVAPGIGVDTVNVNAGVVTLDTNDPDGLTINVNGAGTAVIFNATQHLAALNIGAGASATMAADGNRFLETRALTIAPSGQLDLADNDLIVDYAASESSPEFALRDLVLRARDVGDYGIFFTRTVADDTILAFGEASELGITEFNGVAVDGTTVVGKYTFYGDANLDGQVTTDDYVAVDLGLGTGDSWVQGDFDLNAIVTTDDYVVIDLNLGKGTSDPLAFADDQQAMIEFHAAVFGESYVKAVERAVKQSYKLAGTKKGGGNRPSR